MSVADKDITGEEERSLGADFATAELNNDVMSVEDLEPKTKKKTKGKTKVAGPAPAAEEEEEGASQNPTMGSPEWSDFVLKSFTEDELDPDGRPLVHGLRRVARLLLGPILESRAKVVQAPALLNGLEKLGWLQPATVEYTVKFLWCRDVKNGAAYEATYTDAADVYHGNTDPDYARHATATAATKAEARCLRKALQLKGIAGEEKTVVLPAEAALDGKITPNQVNFLNVLCRRNKMNAAAFINAGKKKYGSVYEIEAGVAAKMVEYLAGLDNSGKVPPELVGYDPKWLD